MRLERLSLLAMWQKATLVTNMFGLWVQFFYVIWLPVDYLNLLLGCIEKKKNYRKTKPTDFMFSLNSFLFPPSCLVSNFLLGFQDMRFGLRIVGGTIIAFFGAACGSVGGVGGGGIFVPMLTLVIGFDSKSSTALSKCKWRSPLLIFMHLKTSSHG